MDSWRLIFLLVLIPILTYAWSSSIEEMREARDMRRGIHYHSKRHMQPTDKEQKKRATTSKPRDVIRKKPSGHLTPLEDDDMDNDEVVSVAIGPPPLRTKYDKINKKLSQKKTHTNQYPSSNSLAPPSSAATVLVKEILVQLGRELMTTEVSENFVFGQYVGMAMKNLTRELRQSFQHDVMDLIIRYQKVNAAGNLPVTPLKETKLEKKNANMNETDENWPDFSNLEKIVG